MKAVEGWEKCKVRDICELGRGRVISGQEIECNPGVFPVYSSQSFNNGNMGAIDTFDFDGEYVTWTTDGAYAGTVFYRSGQFNCTNVCGTLRAKDPQVCMSFLAYKLSTLAKDYVSYVGNPKLMNGVMARIEFSIPTSKSEQTKIAEILSTVDRAIEQTEALIAKQQRIKTGLMQDLLTRSIDEHGNLRSEQTHQFKDSPLGRIPVEWEVKALSDLVDEDITYGIVQAGPHIENGVPYIRTGDMSGDAIDLKTLLRTSKQIAKSYIRSTVHFGDIVFALRATVGKVLPVKEELNGANLTQGTAKISPKDSIDSKFLLWAMRSSKVQDGIRIDLKGTTFMEITLGDLRRVTLALPKRKSEQTMISEKLEKHDCLRRCYERRAGKLRSLKTALMQDLLTGKKRVTSLLADTMVTN